MKVCIVFNSYDDDIEKIFLDKEKARAFKKTGESGDYYVKEFETSDEESYEIVHGFDFKKYIDIVGDNFCASNSKVEYTKDRYVQEPSDDVKNRAYFGYWKEENKGYLSVYGHEFGKKSKAEIAECRKKYLAKFNEIYNLIIEKCNSRMSEEEIQKLLDSIEF